MQNACNMHENLTGLPSGKMETNKQRGRESESTSKRGGEREREIETERQNYAATHATSLLLAHRVLKKFVRQRRA